MKTGQTNIDYFEKMLDNKGKARNWTLLWVGLFTIMAFAIVYVGIINQELNQSLREERLANELLRLKYESDSSTTVLQISQQNTTDLADSMKIKLDAMTTLVSDLEKSNRLLREKVQQVSNNQNTTAVDVELNKIKPTIMKSANPAYTRKENKPNVYIQYMPDFENKLPELRKALTNYELPGAEKITRITFRPTVKYFNAEDQQHATEIAKLAKAATGLDFEAVKTDLKTPVGQLELWMGMYRAPAKNVNINRINSKLKQ